ncbi:MAG: hypothetical protein ACI4EO_06580 [Blautia sp.]
MNRLLHPRHKAPGTTLLFCCITAVVIFFLLKGIDSVSETTSREEMENLKQSILQSAVHCYATEGVYPDSLAYLEQHYGITYDHNKYLVSYEITGTNLMPDITVIPLTGQEAFP